jgi:transcription antitermination factor NusG
MQKNWYIIYTKPGTEKKLAALLTKRKIENFCPLNCKEMWLGRKKKIVRLPLFSSYVFVNTSETQLKQLKDIEHILSLVYWKGNPAKVSDDEIDIIKQFSNNYQNIKLVRSKVVENAMVTINSPSYSIDGNLLSVKNRTMKANLPSLGYIVTAEIETEGVMGSEISFAKNRLMLQ